MKYLFSVLVLLACSLMLFSCVPSMKRNPNKISCTNNCVKSKNSCMIEASTSKQIDACDISINKCLELCNSMPEFIQTE